MKRKMICIGLMLSMLFLLSGCTRVESKYPIQAFQFYLESLPDETEVTVFQTKEELNVYVDELFKQYEYETLDEFLAAVGKYDENYFAENALLLNRVSESGSMKFIVKDVEVTGEEGVVRFSCVTTGDMTADEYKWGLLVEIPQELAAKTYRAEFEDLVVGVREYENLE